MNEPETTSIFTNDAIKLPEIHFWECFSLNAMKKIK